MFKKSLAALAVLGAAAGYASAADVTLFGVVDTGLIYTHQTFADDSKADVNNFAMDSGVSSASRFGLKGTEELGNGLKVGFKLENGFQSDSGALKSEKRIFDREASVSLYSDFGTLSMGRMGGVGSGAGTYDLVLATADAFDGGDNNVFGFATSDRYDNMVTYQTPSFSGFQATVQYSLNESSVDNTKRENSSQVDRYLGLALTAELGAFQSVLAYETQNYASFGDKAQANTKDGQVVYLGGNYDFGVTRLFAMAQYFKGLSATQLTAIADETRAETADNMWSDGAKGYGLHLGTVTPVFGGDFTAGLYFVDAKFQNGANAANQNDADLSYYGAALRYGYPLSKRTTVYTGVGYGVSKLEFNNNGQDVEAKNQVGQAYLGLTHMF